RRAGYRWFNALPPTQARRCLVDAGLGQDEVSSLVERRPLQEGAPHLPKRVAAIIEGPSPI
ncbi:MAG: allantoicase, partial [Candidatus Dormibacter sp.]